MSDFGLSDPSSSGNLPHCRKEQWRDVTALAGIDKHCITCILPARV